MPKNYVAAFNKKKKSIELLAENKAIREQNNRIAAELQAQKEKEQ